MSNYECSVCGAGAYYDGRCGDGPILTCGCNRGEYVKDRMGGYYTNPTRAKPIKSHDSFWGSRPRKTREVIKGSNGTTVIIVSEEKEWDY